MRGTTAAVLLLATNLSGVQAATGGPETERKEPYQVRFLVFQYQGYWDSPLATRGPDAQTDGGTEGSDGGADSGGTEGNSTMGTAWDKLRESARYRPLLRDLAVPFDYPREKAEPIPLSGSWPASIRLPFAAMDSLADRPIRLASGRSWAREGFGAHPFSDRIRGSITFSKGRYPHLDVDLVFTEAQRWMPWGVDVRHYFMRQSRRILPNRFYYFDHPRFGLIAYIEPMGG
ncbi:CsiV family protein [Thiohalorhabdus sp.]|uniref:CsiV family protein n=1 Tax=Thiohalorhabdus sp. TaxID=3094134 RepID=UPI002FC39B66